jgi:hypothetical protein
LWDLVAATADRGARSLADQAVGPKSPQQLPDDWGEYELADEPVRDEGVSAGSGVDERERGHQVASLLGESGGDRAACGVAHHDGVLHAEPVQCLADPASLLRNRIAPAGRFG